MIHHKIYRTVDELPEAWDALLKARAIENMSYCIGVNRVGLDGNNYEYSGHSVVFDVLGKKISSIKPSIDQIEVVELNKNHIGKTVTLCGWNNKSRDLGGLHFIDIRDKFGLTQLAFDEFKGDFARAYFYMATRYENEIASWEGNSTSSDAVLDGTNTTVFEPWLYGCVKLTLNGLFSVG